LLRNIGTEQEFKAIKQRNAQDVQEIELSKTQSRATLSSPTPRTYFSTDKIQSIDQDLVHLDSAVRNSTQLYLSSPQTRTVDAERIALSCQVTLLTAAAARLWNSRHQPSRFPKSLFRYTLYLVRETRQRFEDSKWIPRVFNWQLNDPAQLPDIAAVFDRYGDGYTWDNMVVLALVTHFCYCEVEGREDGERILEALVVEDIVVDNTACKGVMKYTRDDILGNGRRSGEVVVWW
jgi:hypothetical protein